MNHLRLEDIADVRTYEREREAFRQQVIALKRRRRVSVGPLVTLVFENRDTIRFQVQEMARAERMTTDRQIQGELDVYNPLIPGPGELSATLFVELTTEADLREWLVKLVGIERSVRLEMGEGGQVEVAAEPEAAHEASLTRQDVTASVHYVRFRLDRAAVEAFARGPVHLAVRHPAYDAEAELEEGTAALLLDDLRGTGTERHEE